MDRHFRNLRGFNRIFREAGIRLPFPQMDLHVRDWNPSQPPAGTFPTARDAEPS